VIERSGSFHCQCHQHPRDQSQPSQPKYHPCWIRGYAVAMSWGFGSAGALAGCSACRHRRLSGIAIVVNVAAVVVGLSGQVFE
jgi:hypothetical protein